MIYGIRRTSDGWWLAHLRPNLWVADARSALKYEFETIAAMDAVNPEGADLPAVNGWAVEPLPLQETS